MTHTNTLNEQSFSFVFADDDCHISKEITVNAHYAKEAHKKSWEMLTEEEKDACGCWTCIDVIPA